MFNLERLRSSRKVHCEAIFISVRSYAWHLYLTSPIIATVLETVIFKWILRLTEAIVKGIPFQLLF